MPAVIARTRFASWRWICAVALTAASLAATALPAPQPGPSSSSSSAAVTTTPAIDPLTPAVAEIAWRDPQQRIETIVRFEPHVAPAAATALVRAHRGQVLAQIDLIRGVAAEITAGDAATLARTPGVYSVSLNAPVASHAVDISPQALATSFNESVRSPKVWYGRKHAATGKGVGVAVIDTGIEGDVPDFAVSETDPTSRVVVSARTRESASYGDGYGHGTHVAGLIAGNGENRGGALEGRYAGVAPEANLISVKVSDDAGEATLLDVIAGLEFVVDHKDDYGIRVANLSLNSTVAESYKTDPLDAAVEQAWLNGIVVVTAAGNRGTSADAVHYAPANDPYVISVGAVDDRGTKDVADDALADWSSRGVTQDGIAKPDVLAPGAHIVSTLAPGSRISKLCASCVRDEAYFRMGGTSMASAIAAGVAALIVEEHPNWTPDQVKGALRNRLREVPGAGGAVAADKAIGAPGSRLLANQGLTPSTLIDPETKRIDWEGLRWSGLRWSSDDADPSGLRWSGLRWSLAPEAFDVPTEDVEAKGLRWSGLRWSGLRWSGLRWSHSFSK